MRFAFQTKLQPSILSKVLWPFLQNRERENRNIKDEPLKRKWYRPVPNLGNSYQREFEAAAARSSREKGSNRKSRYYEMYWLRYIGGTFKKTLFTQPFASHSANSPNINALHLFSSIHGSNLIWPTGYFSVSEIIRFEYAERVKLGKPPNNRNIYTVEIVYNDGQGKWEFRRYIRLSL